MDILSPFVPVVKVAGVDCEPEPEATEESCGNRDDKGPIGKVLNKLASIAPKRSPSVGKTVSRALLFTRWVFDSTASLAGEPDSRNDQEGQETYLQVLQAR